jgi:hypothetical protein
MPTIRSCLLLAALPALLPAQSVTTTLSALTPLTVTTPAGPQSVGPGPLAPAGTLGTSTPGPGTFSWSTWVGTSEVGLVLDWSGNANASIGPSELLLTIAAPTATQAIPLRFEGLFEDLGAVGFLQMGVDIGNDGTVDWQLGQGTSPLIVGGDSPDVATQPIQLRLILDYQQQAATQQQTFRFRLRATRGGVFVQRLATACGLFQNYSAAASLETGPSAGFGDVLELRSQGTLWHVVGLSPQPTLLPPALTLTTYPCLVIPATDLVIRTGTLFLGVPAAASRPLVLHSQLLDFLPNQGLRVSDSYQIVLL